MKHQKIVVSGFLYQEGKALLIRRAEHETFLPGHYELPGGKVDFGESAEDALIREFKEETNLDITILHPYRTFSYVTGDRHTLEIVFVVSCNDITSLQLSKDHDDTLWLSASEEDFCVMSDEIRVSFLEGFRHINQ